METREPEELEVNIPLKVMEAKLCSSNGEVLFNPITGHVTALAWDMSDTRPGEDMGAFIPARVDVKEWAEYHLGKIKERLEGEEDGIGAILYPEGDHDILDFGLWMADGKYSEPDHNWRELIIEMRQEKKEYDEKVAREGKPWVHNVTEVL